MRRFRTQWLAFLGALVILSLSLSTAFGARPTIETSQVTGFGQQVSTFVHVLLSGTSNEDGSGNEDQDQDQDEDSGDTEECQPASDEDSTGDETSGDETSGDETSGDETSGDETSGDETSGDETSGDESTGDESTGDESTGDQDQSCDQPEDDSADDSGDTSGDESGGDAPDSAPQNHGQCVAAVAHSDAVGDNGTHGWAVALAAQITCWLELSGGQSPDSGSEDAGSTGGTGTEDASTTSSTRAHGKSDAAHQRKLDRGKGKPDWASASTHGSHGKGHGKGHNR